MKMTEEKNKAFICYSHEAKFLFRKKEFFELLGLNPDAFYEIVAVEDRDNTIELKITVRSGNNFFGEDS
jgi:hypothetical protein